MTSGFCFSGKSLSPGLMSGWLPSVIYVLEKAWHLPVVGQERSQHSLSVLFFCLRLINSLVYGRCNRNSPEHWEFILSPGEMMTFFPVVLPSLLCSLHLAPIIPKINSQYLKIDLEKVRVDFVRLNDSLRNFAAFPPKQN